MITHSYKKNGIKSEFVDRYYLFDINSIKDEEDILDFGKLEGKYKEIMSRYHNLSIDEKKRQYQKKKIVRRIIKLERENDPDPDLEILGDW
jgi:hypothetical protein